MGRTKNWLAAFAISFTSVVGLASAYQDCLAVDPAKSGKQSGTTQTEAEPSNRDAENLRQARDQAVRERNSGAPDRHTRTDQGEGRLIRPRPDRARWILGVRVWYLDTGARVTQVFPNTPAWRVGLEPRDVIVSIDGYQIGYVNRHFYELSDELNARAERSGWVRLLVQNCRNNELVNIDVKLARIGGGFPRERRSVLPGVPLDQVDAGTRDQPDRQRASP